MNDALDRIRERTVQLRDAHTARMQSAIAAAQADAAARSGGYVVGARVFDTVSGLEGEIVGTTRENVLVPAAGE